MTWRWPSVAGMLGPRGIVRTLRVQEGDDPTRLHKWQLLHDPLLDEVLDTVDFERLGTLPRERKNDKWFKRPEKFFARALAEARAIGLDTGPPRRVLDLGAGAGYFLHVAQFFGHTALGLERAMAVCAPFHAWLGVDAVAGSVTARTPLQAFPDRFDVVTAQKIQFDVVQGPAGKRYWGVEEWGFLLDDLRENVLRPGGSVYLRLNKRNRSYTGPRFGDPELAADWTARGGVPAALRRSTLFAPLLPGPQRAAIRAAAVACETLSEPPVRGDLEPARAGFSGYNGDTAR